MMDRVPSDQRLSRSILALAEVSSPFWNHQFGERGAFSRLAAGCGHGPGRVRGVHSLCQPILRAARSASRTSGPANFAAAASRPSAKSVPPLAALRSPKAILDPLLGLSGAVSVIVMKETSMINFITAYFMDVEARTICSVAIDSANGLADTPGYRGHGDCRLVAGYGHDGVGVVV